MKKIYFQKRLLESFQKNRERIAIEYGAREIKYSQLEKKCLSVSNWLLGHKTSKGSFIGIYIEDRVDFIAVLLGILNIGGVFIPLDTHLPVKRIEKMLQVTQPGLIICDQQGQGKLLHHLQTSINPGRIICISQVFNEQDNLQLSLEDVVEYSSQDPIYVYFTSGTTGTPKAILGKNISLLHFINWEIQTFSINETFQVSQLTALSFDAFLRDLFVPLLVGGTLCIPGNPEILMDSESLIYWLETNRIGLVHCVPSIFRIFNTKALKKENFQHLKYILLSGESIIPQELKNWFDIMGDRIQLVNLYGPTETTMIKTCYYIKKEDVNRGRIPIGKPMKGARLILFDKNMKICEPGFIGDIYIRTPYRTFGYLNDPQLNLEKFIPNPLGGEQTDLLFKTGDQGLELSEGDFEFIGRRDRQVKIRGIRVELEEVERAMLQYPYIDNAAVIDREEKDRDKYLCAYFISRGTVEISELREYLSEELPDYMIPSYFQQLEAFPMNPNGKLDRKALPAPGFRPVENDEAPVGRIPETLVNIWSEVLKVDRKQIGINSDFFELGGHSLKAIMLASGIHQALNVKIALTQIFKTPTIRGLSGYIKQEHKHLQTQDRYIAIEPVEKKEYYALSSAQKRLFIMHQLDEKGIGYNMPRVVDLEGNLDRDCLEETFKKLIGRHESLRTSFEMVKDDPVQKIHQDFCLEIEYYCAERKAQRAERKEERYAPSTMRYASTIKDFVRPFDLSQAPLLRVGLIKIAIDKHILMVDMHHIISDATSMDIFIRDFIALYSGAGLPGLEISYKDYSGWHNKEKEYIKHQEEFWAREFSGEISVLELHTDYARPGVLSFEGQRVRFQLEDKITNALNQLAREQDATLYMVLLAIYNIWLSKISGQEDIIVGSPIAGRRHADLESTIGMFVNTLALRNYPVGGKTCKEFLTEVKKNTFKAFDNQDYQFEDLVGKLELKRDTSRNPLFDVMFVLQNYESASPEIPGLEMRELRDDTFKYEWNAAKFDLTIYATEVGEQLHFTVEYSTTLFKPGTIDRFIRYFKEVLTSVLKDIWLKLSELEITTREEKRQILFDFNNTDAEYPIDKTIHELFEEQVERAPDHIALVGKEEGWKGRRVEGKKAKEPFGKINAFGRMHLTYKELNKKSNQLAYLLQEKGVQPDTIAAIMVERSINMLVGIMAILKAGGAYLPIDPEYPVERINYMLSDSHAKILLTTKNIAKAINFDKKMIYLNSSSPQASLNLSEGRLFNSHHSSFINHHSKNLAYVIYTSGSTGKPKVAMIRHRNVVNYISWAIKQYVRGENVRFPLFTSFSFDLTVTSIFTPLLSGNTIVVYAGEGRGSLIEKVVEENLVEVVKLTPSHFKLIGGLVIDSFQSCIKRFIVGGEALESQLARKIVEKFKGDIVIYNEYGPTEATVGCMIYPFCHETDTKQSVPIGIPAYNVQVFILDKNEKPFPVGVVGELYISGDGVARGYLNQPELTAERFVHLILTTNTIYKTGDLARWLQDGNIEFFGRIDHQVKIRGFRIEPGEIENRLMAVEYIKEAVVIDRKDEKGDKYLAAYIVSAKTLNTTELRNILSKSLPDYMIPSYFVPLEAIPLTPNAKIDRRALPEPEIRIDEGHIPPGNVIEVKLAGIWAGILALEKEQIGIDDDFFQLGGHSLKAAIMTAKIHKELNIKLPLADVFETPTLKGLAEIITGLEKSKFAPIELAEEKEFYPLSSAQKRLYITHMMGKESTSYNISTIVTIEGKLERKRFSNGFQRLTARHESLRTSFIIVRGVTFQRVHKEGNFECEYFDLPGMEQGREQKEKEIIKNFIKPFDLAQATLLRVGLVKLEEEKHLLIMDMHHIISDGTSVNVLIKDMMALYGGESLPAPRIQYKDFSEWQNSKQQEELIKKQEEYWLKEFEGEIPVLNLPTDFERSILQSYEGGVVSFSIAQKETRLLKKIALEEGTTLFMVLLAIYSILLSRISNQDVVVIGTSAAGRLHIDLETVLGMFVNTLALKISPEKGKTFKEFLCAVKNKTLEAFDNQDYQFDDMVEKLSPPRVKGRNPIFDVRFTMNNFDITAVDIPGLTVNPYEYVNNVSKFDLSLLITENGETLNGRFEYCSKLYKEETIIQFVDYIEEILQLVVENVNMKLESIALTHGFTMPQIDTNGIDLDF